MPAKGAAMILGVPSSFHPASSPSALSPAFSYEGGGTTPDHSKMQVVLAEGADTSRIGWKPRVVPLNVKEEKEVCT